jgi:hypothetical protein
MRQDSPETHNHPFGAQINNSLSTPVAIAAIVVFFAAGVMGGIAISIANSADDKAVIAEREARLAQERGDRLEVEIKVLRGVLETVGVPVQSQE